MKSTLSMALAALPVLFVLGTGAASAQRESGRTRPPESQPAKTPLAEEKTLDPAQVVKEATAIILKLQEGDERAEWPYEGVYRVAGKIPLGYRVGGTAIAATALLESGRYEESTEMKAAVERAVGFILKALDDPQMSAGFTGAYDVRGWGHAYALLFFLRAADLKAIPKKHETAVKAATDWLVETLQKTAIPESGGWNYSRRSGFKSPRSEASPFMTGPTLHALFYAAQRQKQVDAKLIETALDALERGRNESGGYDYASPVTPDKPQSEDALGMMDKLPGAAGRMTVAEATLVLGGRGDQARLVAAVESFFTNWQNLEDRRQGQGTHIPPYGVAPYYVYYAHYYTAFAIELIADQELKAKQRERLNRTLSKSRMPDGGWNDRVFPRSESFGTAMALMALRMKDIPMIPAWKKTTP